MPSSERKQIEEAKYQAFLVHWQKTARKRMTEFALQGEERRKYGYLPIEPPFEIIKFPELLGRAWGWDDILPYNHVDCWSLYKTYLQEFYKRNAPAELPRRMGADAAADHNLNGEDGNLPALINLCINVEGELLQLLKHRAEEFNVDEISLKEKLTNCAHQITNMECGRFPAPSIALKCILAEAHLLCELLTSKTNITSDECSAAEEPAGGITATNLTYDESDSNNCSEKEVICSKEELPNGNHLEERNEAKKNIKAKYSDRSASEIPVVDKPGETNEMKQMTKEPLREELMIGANLKKKSEGQETKSHACPWGLASPYLGDRTAQLQELHNSLTVPNELVRERVAAKGLPERRTREVESSSPARAAAKSLSSPVHAVAAAADASLPVSIRTVRLEFFFRAVGEVERPERARSMDYNSQLIFSDRFRAASKGSSRPTICDMDWHPAPSPFGKMLALCSSKLLRAFGWNGNAWKMLINRKPSGMRKTNALKWNPRKGSCLAVATGDGRRVTIDFLKLKGQRFKRIKLFEEPHKKQEKVHEQQYLHNAQATAKPTMPPPTIATSSTSGVVFTPPMPSV
ncbi:hypothetical protein EJB05_03447 [Eragrostis curvula]|uniref:Uncharacterized protein n=1 Tax=Eragrostis curvula TaxID=38414 RepID=A0A5J9W7V1_9POAL|nr:hypothetical protein EJB05_03447 [Eragrostis curvula]